MTIIYLGRRLPDASSGLPGGGASELPAGAASELIAPFLLSGLAPDGVYLSQPVTWLLVSSYLAISPLPVAGRYVSVALSLGLPPLDVIQHPALWSSDFPQTAENPPAIVLLAQAHL